MKSKEASKEYMSIWSTPRIYDDVSLNSQKKQTNKQTIQITIIIMPSGDVKALNGV